MLGLVFFLWVCSLVGRVSGRCFVIIWFVKCFLSVLFVFDGVGFIVVLILFVC